MAAPRGIIEGHRASVEARYLGGDAHRLNVLATRSERRSSSPRAVRTDQPDRQHLVLRDWRQIVEQHERLLPVGSRIEEGAARSGEIVLAGQVADACALPQRF